MAKRWSFREDYIVGKFIEKTLYLALTDERLDELIKLLSDDGFDSRSRVAIHKRAVCYKNLFLYNDDLCNNSQILAIYRILNNKGYSEHLIQLHEYISKRCKDACEIEEQYNLSENPSNLIHMVHKAKGARFIDILEDYIQNSGINPKSKIYREVGMKQETYSAIRRGKYKNISRENIYKLCFGLRLNYDDAIRLMEAGGCKLRGDSVLDAVVEYFLRQGPTVDSVNRVKQEKGNKYEEKVCYIYDTYQIDADLLESEESELFWGFRAGDDKDDD